MQGRAIIQTSSEDALQPKRWGQLSAGLCSERSARLSVQIEDSSHSIITDRGIPCGTSSCYPQVMSAERVFNIFVYFNDGVA
ncbi:MAG TPA: hypothetical protein VMV54_01170, partial [Acidocella sp.]|nr:hypothetical protein [Acidocella sp.]